MSYDRNVDVGMALKALLYTIIGIIDTCYGLVLLECSILVVVCVRSTLSSSGISVAVDFSGLIWCGPGGYTRLVARVNQSTAKPHVAPKHAEPKSPLASTDDPPVPALLLSAHIVLALALSLLISSP